MDLEDKGGRALVHQWDAWMAAKLVVERAALKLGDAEGISDVEGASPELVSQMREMIDAPVNRSRSGLSRGRRGSGAAGGRGPERCRSRARRRGAGTRGRT